MISDQVAERLGVGLRLKAIALFGQEFLHPDVIFDHAVMHQRNLAITTAMWVRIGFGDVAVRGPTSVTDAEGAAQIITQCGF